jgi:soluble lytic murein transglycosylase
MKSKLKYLVFLAIILMVEGSFASTLTLEKQRKKFVLAEKMLEKGRDRAFFRTAKTLKNYPLYPYLQYHWLKKNLHQSKKVRRFLSEYPQTRYAILLHYKWQIYQAKHKYWKQFLKHYRETKNIKLQCHYHRAKYNTGAKKEALMGAKKMWVAGRSLPSECDPVFKVLQNSSYFTKDMLWQRFQAALTKNKRGLASYVKRLMNKNDQTVAQLWLDVHAKPSLVTKKKLLNNKHVKAGLIFAHGIDRMARTDPVDAIRLWDARKSDFKINSVRMQRLERRLAMALAFRGDHRAYKRLSHLKAVDEVAQEWRVRAALREQNWVHVKQSIDQLDKEIKKKDKWQYWLARAQEQTGKPKAAKFIFDKLAKDRSFYGYLSADKSDVSYKLSDHPVQVTKKMMSQFKQRTDFMVVAELIKMQKPLEAKRQWWYAVKKLDKKQILIAAKYAQQLDWKQTAIFTIAKAKYWDDVSIRFPMAYQGQVLKNAKVQKLNPAVIFGLIRRESAFDQKAMSPVGARGLMQIMPKTGRQIARELKDKWQNKNKLFNPEINVKYGAYYYKQLLDQFNGHYALAAAAYNAGPHRVKRWLPDNKPLAADVWVETIPFKETRAYVSAVLTYALIYQKQLKKNSLTMKRFMRDVFPG